MRLRKVVNRVHRGRVYYRFLVSVPPKDVRLLGWVDGQPLETVVRGETLWISPMVRSRPRGRQRQAEILEEHMRERSFTRG